MKRPAPSGAEEPPPTSPPSERLARRLASGGYLGWVPEDVLALVATQLTPQQRGALAQAGRLTRSAVQASRRGIARTECPTVEQCERALVGAIRSGDLELLGAICQYGAAAANGFSIRNVSIHSLLPVEFVSRFEPVAARSGNSLVDFVTEWTWEGTDVNDPPEIEAELTRNRPYIDDVVAVESLLAERDIQVDGTLSIADQGRAEIEPYRVATVFLPIVFQRPAALALLLSLRCGRLGQDLSREGLVGTVLTKAAELGFFAPRPVTATLVETVLRERDTDPFPTAAEAWAEPISNPVLDASYQHNLPTLRLLLEAGFDPNLVYGGDAEDIGDGDQRPRIPPFQRLWDLLTAAVHADFQAPDFPRAFAEAALALFWQYAGPPVAESVNAPADRWEFIYDREPVAEMAAFLADLRTGLNAVVRNKSVYYSIEPSDRAGRSSYLLTLTGSASTVRVVASFVRHRGQYVYERPHSRLY